MCVCVPVTRTASETRAESGVRRKCGNKKDNVTVILRKTETAVWPKGTGHPSANNPQPAAPPHPSTP